MNVQNWMSDESPNREGPQTNKWKKEITERLDFSFLETEIST